MKAELEVEERDIRERLDGPLELENLRLGVPAGRAIELNYDVPLGFARGPCATSLRSVALLTSLG